MAGIVKPVNNPKDELTCFMCLQIYSYPVSLSCTHSFCLKCIQDHFKYRDDTEKYSSSFCVAHLRPHNEKVYLQSHVLVEPSEMMALRRCKVHREMLKLFCRDHRTCICTLCSLVGEHKQHMVCTVEEAKMEAEVRGRILKYKTHFFFISGIATPLPVLGKADHNLVLLQPHYKSRVRVLPTTTRSFRKWTPEAEQALRDCFGTTDWDILQGSYSENIEEVVDCTTEYINFCMDIVVPVRTVRCYANNKPWITSDIKGLLKQKKRAFKGGDQHELKHATTITLDPSTANEHLILSEDRTIVRYTDETLKAPYGPKRFDDTLYVMGSEGFNFGRHYWEVITRSKTDWEIGLAYASLPRKGKTWLGRNNISWSLECNGDRCMVWHNNISIRVSINYKLERVGVYLDYTGGTIAFYDAEKISLLHSFHNKFTEFLLDCCISEVAMRDWPSCSVKGNTCVLFCVLYLPFC
uniref:Uncharacterized protein n=1 Tax=Erpetoichthys calabaricus TaxID=27687 RepID=A0A8C4RGC7_ERPCA